jgi:RsiW-degrading membrane proteinase PrsW (M82 family)
MELSPNTQSLPVKRPKANSWLQVFITGLIFYVIATILLVATQNPNLFPTVVMIGSFLVPVTYVTFFYERRHLSNLSISTTVIGFVYGGILGVLAASLLEPIFVRSSNLSSNLVIGLIEEFAKILGVLVIARRFRHDMEMDGLILGAAAGMGFASLESMGYAFTAFLSSGGSLSQTVVVTLIRGILSPVGHGTWTAIFAAVLFREVKNRRFRINFYVIGAYLLVSLLHAAWDGLPTLITDFVGSGPDVFIGQAVIGVAGLLVLWLLWRDARRRQEAAALASVMDTPLPPDAPIDEIPPSSEESSSELN